MTENNFLVGDMSVLRRKNDMLTRTRRFSHHEGMVGTIHIEKTAARASAERLFYVQIKGTSEGANLLYRTSRFYSERHPTIS